MSAAVLLKWEGMSWHVLTVPGAQTTFSCCLRMKT